MFYIPGCIVSVLCLYNCNENLRKKKQKHCVFVSFVGILALKSSDISSYGILAHTVYCQWHKSIKHCQRTSLVTSICTPNPGLTLCITCGLAHTRLYQAGSQQADRASSYTLPIYTLTQTCLPVMIKARRYCIVILKRQGTSKVMYVGSKSKQSFIIRDNVQSRNLEAFVAHFICILTSKQGQMFLFNSFTILPYGSVFNCDCIIGLHTYSCSAVCHYMFAACLVPVHSTPSFCGPLQA